MKKDYELIKRILIVMGNDDNLEEDGKGYAAFGFDEADVSERDFYTQTGIMTREGLIKSEKQQYISDPYPKYLPILITPDGYKFLELAKSETGWRKALDFVKNAGNNVALPILINKISDWL